MYNFAKGVSPQYRQKQVVSTGRFNERTRCEIEMANVDSAWGAEITLTH